MAGEGYVARLLKTGETAAALAKRRLDSFVNFATGIGSSRDKVYASIPYYQRLLTVTELESLFTGSDLARRIVKTLPEEVFKQGFGFSRGDDDPSGSQEEQKTLEAEVDRLRVVESFIEAMCWGRLYGWGGILMGVDDGGADLAEPLNPDRVRGVRYLLSLDKRDATPMQYYDDLSEDHYGEVKTYLIQPTGTLVSADLPGVEVHESRIIIFGGALTSRRERARNNFADHSVLQAIYEVLQQVDSTWGSVTHLMADVSQGVFKVKGLLEMMLAGTSDVLQTRMQVVEMGRSTARAIILDADGEDFRRVETPLAGVPEIIRETWQRLAAAAEMPLTVLMGMSPAGLNATGESDIRLWYDKIQNNRTKRVQPPLERVIRLIARSIGHSNPDTWSVTWPSLWQMSAVERAQHYKLVADADHLYVQDGVLLPEEVALSRFARGPDFSADSTTIDADARKKALEQAVKELTAPPKPPPAVPPIQAGKPPGVMPGMTNGGSNGADG